MVTVSKNGWTNSEIFLSYLQHFVASPHPSLNEFLYHTLPQQLCSSQKNKSNDFSHFSRTTHILEPHDVTVFGAMKSFWRKRVKDLLKSCGYKPTRKDSCHSWVPYLKKCQPSVTCPAVSGKQEFFHSTNKLFLTLHSCPLLLISRFKQKLQDLFHFSS